MQKGVSKTRRRKTRKRSRGQRYEGAAIPPPRFKDSPALTRIYLGGFGVACVLLLSLPWHLSATPVPTTAFVIIMLLLCVRMLMERFTVATLQRNSRILLVVLVSLLGLGFFRVALCAGSSLRFFPDLDMAVFLVPYTFVPTVLALLLGGGVALSASIMVAVLGAWMWADNLPVLLLGVFSAVVMVYGTYRARRRVVVIRTAFVVGVVQLSVIFIQGSARGFALADDPAAMFYRALASFAGATAGALIGLLALPLIEHLFALTSDITLMAFADLGHPLLQKLALHAPGSYHHSLVVGNLAQAAADSIGANGLLARVGSYYHDIGKLDKTHFYTENTASREVSSHDNLPPNISRLIIANHVKEGVSLGLLYKIPLPVMAIIREHHGTSLISCFHHKAKQAMRDGDAAQASGGGCRDASENHYRYEGPLPSSRESAIVCLADSVEAASRCLGKAGPSSIDGLVGNVIQGKISDGQLDASGLTLDDLARIKRSFVATLGNMLHVRTSYPADENQGIQPSTVISPGPA